MTPQRKAVVCFSGGLDSTVLLYQLKALDFECFALSVDYGQRHGCELINAKNITDKLGIVHHVVNLGSSVWPLLTGSSQTSPHIPVPEGHYAEESMKATVVPNRNMILLSLATAWAITLKAERVGYACHAGDHTIYPDCRPEFAEAMTAAISLCDWHKLFLYRPFINKTKADIVAYGDLLNVSFQMTYSCYKGEQKHCGRCGTCVERKEAFQLANILDPTLYES